MQLNKIFIIAVISLFVVSVGPQALGYGGAPEQSSTNNSTVEISTDSESYVHGESVIFSGTVNKYDEDRSLRITIFDSKSNLVVTQKTTVNEDSTFSHTIPLNQKFDDGKHIVKAQYGNTKATVAIMSFEITDSIVEGWSARTSLRGGSGANLQLKATGGTDILALLGDTYSIYADVDGTTWPVYTGILQSGTLSTSASSSGVSFDVELSSQVASLDNKPINTEKFGDSTTPVTSQSILTTMFDRYGSIDSSLYSFGGSYGSVFEYITVQGDSLIQEARLIAG